MGSRMIDEDTIEISEEEMLNSEYAKLCFVGKLWTTRKFNAEALVRTLTSIWRTTKGIEAKEIEKNLFLFQFFHWEDKKRVIDGAPRLFDKHFLILREVPGSLAPNEVQLDSLPVWIRLSNIPFNLRSESVLRKICEKVGTLVRQDETDEKRMGNWVRMLVEINLTKPLVPSVRIKMPDGSTREVSVSYEKFATFCYGCARLGHTFHHCDVVENDGVDVDDLPYNVNIRAPPVKRGVYGVKNGEALSRPIGRKLVIGEGHIGADKGKLDNVGNKDKGLEEVANQVGKLALQPEGRMNDDNTGKMVCLEENGRKCTAREKGKQEDEQYMASIAQVELQPRRIRLQCENLMPSFVSLYH